jgi:hypothetical protein
MTTNSLSPEEQKKQVSNLQEAGYHLMMEDIDTGSCKSAIEFILENNFNNEVKKPKVKSKKPKPPAESDDELAFLGKPPVESSEEEEIKSQKTKEREAKQDISDKRL